MTEPSTITVYQRVSYTQIDNFAVSDHELSNSALGLLVRLCRYKDKEGWQFYQSHLLTTMPEGRTAFRTQLKELTERGYVRVDKARNEDGTLRYDWSVADWPKFNEGSVSSGGTSTSGETTGGEQPPSNTNRVRLIEEKNKNTLSESDDSSSATEDGEDDSPKAKIDKADLILALWKKLKRPEWVDHRTISRTELNHYRELERQFGRSAAPTEFARAIQWAAQHEEWTRGKSIALKNLGSNSKLVEYAERAASSAQKRAATPYHKVAVALGEGDRVLYRGAHPGRILEVLTENTRYKVQLKNESIVTAYRDELEVFDKQ